MVPTLGASSIDAFDENTQLEYNLNTTYDGRPIFRGEGVSVPPIYRRPLSPFQRIRTSLKRGGTASGEIRFVGTPRIKPFRETPHIDRSV